MMMKNDFFGFPKVKWLRLKGEVDKSVRCSWQIFSGFNIPKVITIGYFDSYSKKLKGGRFWGHRVGTLL